MLRTTPGRLVALSLSALAAGACSGGGSAGLPSCKAAFSHPVTLAAGAYSLLDPAQDSGCAVFAADTGADTIVYLVVAQSASGTPGVQAGFSLHGLGAPSAAAVAAFGAAASPALRFHDLLREMESRRDYARLPGAGLRPAAAPAATVDTLNQQRSFHICANLNCTSFKLVTATAKAVDSTIVIYVDNANPSGGLSQGQLDSLGQEFDSRLYAVDTTAFGLPSDIDGNGKVLVLMTAAVNALVTKADCNATGGAFVAGYFFGFDIDPSPSVASNPNSNRAEIFYAFAPDPSGTVSCAHSVAQVQQFLPVTFIHEFQHMISYNQHVILRGGDAEVLWLNEGMSHFAEELGGRSFLPGNDTAFSTFVAGDVLNAYHYMDTTGNHFLLPTAGIGSLAERGAAWLFVRYIADQFRADTSFAATAAFTRKIDDTNLLGAANVTAQTNVHFDTLVTRWALANYVGDLPGFTAPPELKYVSWAFHSEYASLHAQDPADFPKTFPITPPTAPGDSVRVTGTLRAGSGVYQLVVQPPGALGFTLQLTAGGGGALPGSAVGRLDVIRIR